MTIQEFSDRYYLHDSIVSSINYNKDAETLEIVLDFCYWAQEGYDKSHPATGPLIITFKGVSKYDGPLENLTGGVSPQQRLETTHITFLWMMITII